MNEVDANLLTLIGDAAVYLARDRWFQLLQSGNSVAMTEAEKITYSDPNKKRTRVVAYGEAFHPSLYTLAKETYDNMKMNKALYFTRLPAQETKTIHVIGRFIAARRKCCTRSMVQSTPDFGFIDMLSNPDYADNEEYWYLSQESILEFFYVKWGSTIAELMKPTTDDKARLVGILFTDSEMRDFIPDLTGKSLGEIPDSSARNNGSNRRNIDASKSRKVLGKKLLHEKFIDSEVIVPEQEGWLDDTTRTAIDNLLGAGTFAAFGHFNPNNMDRIRLPWNEQQVAAVHAKFHREYQGCMDKYTQGTGGGPGAPENFAAWEARDTTNVVTYTDSQDSMIYLSWAHVWDKQYGYLYVSRKDGLPQGCQITDGTTTHHIVVRS